MLRQYTESNPAILKMKAQLDALRAQPGLAPTQAEKARLDSQKARLAAELARANADQARAQAEQARSRTLIPAGLPDNWWRNAGMVSLLRLTPSQVSQMEDNFQQHRLKLIDLNASLEKEEVTLEPLVSADTLDEVKLTAQLDRVAQARAELEKYRGRMLVGIRRVLDPEQWRQLNETRFVLRKPPVR
jgi:Spy/CpxP family protein refolding chaperone